MFNEFKTFAMKGSVMDLAIGVIIGASFSKIVDSLVNDIIMPPLGLIAGKIDFSNLYINLGDATFPTLAAAKAAGAPTLNYGLFINALINFLIIAFVIFILVKQINKLKSEKAMEKPITRECPHCFSAVNIKATKCPACTAEIKDQAI